MALYHSGHEAMHRLARCPSLLFPSLTFIEFSWTFRNLWLEWPSGGCAAPRWLCALTTYSFTHSRKISRVCTLEATWDLFSAVDSVRTQVSAEILQVSRRQQPGTVAELCIIDKAKYCTCVSLKLSPSPMIGILLHYALCESILLSVWQNFMCRLVWPWQELLQTSRKKSARDVWWRWWLRKGVLQGVLLQNLGMHTTSVIDVSCLRVLGRVFSRLSKFDFTKTSWIIISNSLSLNLFECDKSCRMSAWAAVEFRLLTQPGSVSSGPEPEEQLETLFVGSR